MCCGSLKLVPLIALDADVKRLDPTGKSIYYRRFHPLLPHQFETILKPQSVGLNRNLKF